MDGRRVLEAQPAERVSARARPGDGPDRQPAVVVEGGAAVVVAKRNVDVVVPHPPADQVRNITSAW
jgi:hypothetical protein